MVVAPLDRGRGLHGVDEVECIEGSCRAGEGFDLVFGNAHRNLRRRQNIAAKRQEEFGRAQPVQTLFEAARRCGCHRGGRCADPAIAALIGRNADFIQGVAIPPASQTAVGFIPSVRGSRLTLSNPRPYQAFITCALCAQTMIFRPE
jgi:hypothetical protein